MNLLPQASGTRPRVACEISPQGVVAARSADAASAIGSVAKSGLAAGAVQPSLKPGNLVDRLAVVAAVRSALEGVGMRGNSRGADLTLVIPDGAVRVLLLEFDALPGKLSEALPIVRFRLKKLLPFDADDAMISFQVMSHSRGLVRVLAVAIPRDVLSDYETAVREAGYEPGAVLPSTLASLAAVDDSSGPVLVVNAGSLGVTTAIVRGGVLLLHRSIDLQEPAVATPANIPPAMFEPSAMSLPLVDVHSSAAEWAAQEPLPEHGRNPYADRAYDETAVQNEDGLPVPPAFDIGSTAVYRTQPGDIAHSPYASPNVTAELESELHNAVLTSPTSSPMTPRIIATPNTSLAHMDPAANASEVAQAVSVAAAYFEDTLSSMPSTILSAGPLSANGLTQVLAQQGVAQAEGLHVRELVETSALLSDAVTSHVPRGWLAGVLGALRG